MKDNNFIEGEIAIRKEHDLKLLKDLLYYYYKNSSNFNEEHILNALHDNVLYEDNEKKELLDKAKELIIKEYNIDFNK